MVLNCTFKISRCLYFSFFIFGWILGFKLNLCSHTPTRSKREFFLSLSLFEKDQEKCLFQIFVTGGWVIVTRGATVLTQYIYGKE